MKMNFNIPEYLITPSLPPTPLMSSPIRIEELNGYGAVYSARITRGGVGGVISITTGDSWNGCWGRFFCFLGLCVCLCIRRG